MQIRVLPASVANVIAAGEVVERPASVVKELMENSIDAGADTVSVVVSDAGRTLINVIDNGCGMSPEEAVLCFERHATSKISTAEDLSDIHTFGFRGEALASIAAVAEVTLKTRRAEDEVGCEVSFADSKLVSTTPVATPRGCNFAVRNLFYNVPGRRKFLKSDNVEFKHIISEFTRVAMTRPDVAFSLTHNGKDVFSLKRAPSLKYRIQDLLGPGAVSELVDINAETAVATISGFIGRPDLAKRTPGNQYFFVNGRYFRSPYLNKAVLRGYEQIIPSGVTPSYFICLNVAPESVDVNISPRKTEVKFEDEGVIFQIISACVRENLGKNSFTAAIDFDTDGMPEIPVIGRHYEEFKQVAEPSATVDMSYNPFDNDGFPSEPDHFYNGQAAGGASHGDELPFQFERREKKENYGKLFEDRVLPSKSILVLHDRYIITGVKSGLLVVNIRRAWERILYERFLKAITANAHVTQTALFPVQVQVGAGDVLLFEEYSDVLTAAGFDITRFGKDIVVVNGVPEGYSIEEDKVRTMVADLIVALSDDHSSVPETMTSVIAERLARIGAAGQSPMTSTIEAQRLMDVLFACNNAEYTNSGRKTMTIIPIEDLDKKF